MTRRVDALRREHAFSDAVRRVKAEYLEMPGLKLTRREAARLWGLDDGICEAVLAVLVRDRFLTCTRTDAFVRQD